jgi:predicted MFS family arabinose efflux permease
MLQTELTKKQTLIMAVTAGVCVANVYYSQPLLKDIAMSFHIQNKDAGLVSVLAQAGYGIGLFLITPLGDKIDRKRLLLFLQSALILSLLSISVFNNIYVLYGCSLAIGIFAITAQIVLPMAAAMVTKNRGAVVGKIFTGVLIGVLSARVISGFIGEYFGWRAVYLISSILVAATAVLMQLNFKSKKESFDGHYFKLLESVLNQVGRFSALRRSALTGALIFGTLSAFWTTLTFHLSSSPLNLSTDQIGLFGLLAVMGALLAPLFGRLSDKSNNPKKPLLLAALLVLISIILLHLFPLSIPVISISVLLLDIGVQAAQVTNLALIYTLDTQASSRINTVYMTAYFFGGSFGAFCGLKSFQSGGWNAVTWQMMIFVLLAILVILLGRTFASKKAKVITQ